MRGLLDRFEEVGEPRGERGLRPGEGPVEVEFDRQGESRAVDARGIRGSRESCLMSSRGEGRLNANPGDEEEELERDDGSSVMVELVSNRCSCNDGRDAS